MFTESTTNSKLLYITQSPTAGAMCLSTPKHNGKSGTACQWKPQKRHVNMTRFLQMLTAGHLVTTYVTNV